MDIVRLLLTILFYIVFFEGAIALTLYLSVTFYRFFKEIRRDQKRPPANDPSPDL